MGDLVILVIFLRAAWGSCKYERRIIWSAQCCLFNVLYYAFKFEATDSNEAFGNFS